MNNKRAVVSIDRRLSERRAFRNLSRFPLNTRGDEWILSERRQMPCRRLNSISARWIPVETVLRHPILWLKFHKMGYRLSK